MFIFFCSLLASLTLVEAAHANTNSLSDHLRLYFRRASSFRAEIAGVKFELEMELSRAGQMTKAKIVGSKAKNKLAEQGISLQEVEHPSRTYWELVQETEGNHPRTLLSLTSELAPNNKQWAPVAGKIVVYMPAGVIFERHTFDFVLSSLGDKIEQVSPRKHFPGTRPDLYSVPMKEKGLSISLVTLIFKLTSKNKRREYTRSRIRSKAEELLQGTSYESSFPPERIAAITDDIVAEVSRQTDDFGTSLGHIVATTLLESLRFMDELLPVVIEDLRQKQSPGDLDAINQIARDSVLPLQSCLEQAIQLESDSEAVKCVDKWSAQTPVEISENILLSKLSQMSMEEQAPYALFHYRACLNEHYFSHFVNDKEQIDDDKFSQFKKEWAIFPTVNACLFSTALGTLAQLQEDIERERPHILDTLLSEVTDPQLLPTTEKVRVFSQGTACLDTHELYSGKAAGQTPFGHLLGMAAQDLTGHLFNCFDPMEQALTDALLNYIPEGEQDDMSNQLPLTYQQFKEPFLHSLQELETWTTLYHAMFTRP